jgi:hypothetical protein
MTDASLLKAYYEAYDNATGSHKVKHLAGLRAVVARVNELANDAIREEPELPGPMPDAMWSAINGDKDAIEEGMRIAVRYAKRDIRARIAAALREGRG